jgi:CheY-like chemotaxis protein
MSKRRKTAKRQRARRAHKGKTSAIDLALAALAHDIRTPLTGILAHAELLAASDLGAREQGWALGVKSAAEHLAQLTTIVCDAARADAKGLALRHESFSPRALADDLGASLVARAQMSGLMSQVDIADALPERVVGDAVRLRAAVENLIDNAVKFTARGTVTLHVSASPARGKAKLVFDVTDSGIGLKPAEIKKLFRPFAQASEEVSRRYGGTGLGLTLVRRVARAMGGDLAVTSRPGKGSTFRLHVLAGIENGKPGKARKTRGPILRGGETRARNILCVEDSPYGRVVLNTILRELGDRVDFVPSGDAALRALKRGRYDLVLMDVTLNGADGFAVTRSIRALPKPLGDIPVIGISARSNGEGQARAAGMNAYLSKPVSPSALAETMARLAKI